MLSNIRWGSCLFLPLLWNFTSALPQSATSSASSSSSTAVACNNSPSLCNRAYSNITHLGAHDSPFVSNSSNGYTLSGNQFYGSTEQLSAGVRLLTAQLHNANSSTGQTEIHLCHTDCELYDAGTLEDWLSDIKNWMDDNPNDVVTILLVNSDDNDASDIGSVFESSGITKYAYTQTSSSAPTSWPTLQTLISADTRLITFIASLTSSGNSAAPYLSDEFTYVFENPYTVTSPSNFSCTPDRPSTLGGSVSEAASSNMLFLMNHFLDTSVISDIDVPDVNAANATNSPDESVTGSLGASAAQCAATYGKAPNFLLVDWFNVGPAIDTVDNLNGVTDGQGRTNVSDRILSQNAKGGAVALESGVSNSIIALVIGLVVVISGLL